MRIFFNFFLLSYFNFGALLTMSSARSDKKKLNAVVVDCLLQRRILGDVRCIARGATIKYVRINFLSNADASISSLSLFDLFLCLIPSIFQRAVEIWFTLALMILQTASSGTGKLILGGCMTRNRSNGCSQRITTQLVPKAFLSNFDSLVSCSGGLWCIHQSHGITRFQSMIITQESENEIRASLETAKKWHETWILADSCDNPAYKDNTVYCGNGSLLSPLLLHTTTIYL